MSFRTDICRYKLLRNRVIDKAHNYRAILALAMIDKLFALLSPVAIPADLD